MDEAAARSGGRFWVARETERVERPLPQGQPHLHRAFTENRTETIDRVAVVELPDGRVLGRHHAVITGTGDFVEEICWYFNTSRPSEHPMYLHPFPAPPVQVPGRLGVLASRGDAVYYHFLMDVLPRLGVLEQCAEVAPPDLWYVPANLRYQQQLLDLVGIGPDRRIDSSEVPHVQADCLVVPGLPGTNVQNPAWAVRFLRQRLLPRDVERIPGNNIYVTRGDSPNNRIVRNEEDVLRRLEGRGFRRIDPGTMPVIEQIRAFAEADVIVSAHGSALANIVFASPGACLVELFPRGHVVPDYWKLACGVPGLEYRYMTGVGATDRCDRSRMLVSDIVVDVDALDATLSAAGR
jgi:capsular polysaccharide biosynthesis protein